MKSLRKFILESNIIDPNEIYVVTTRNGSKKQTELMMGKNARNFARDPDNTVKKYRPGMDHNFEFSISGKKVSEREASEVIKSGGIVILTPLFK